MSATECARKTEHGKEKFLIGGISFENKNAVVQLQAADKLIHQSCNALGIHTQSETPDQQVIENLINAKLNKVYVIDKENLPQMFAISEALRLARET